MAPPRYLTLQELISPERLNCSESTLRRMLARGEFIEPLRLSGKTLRWSSESVERWMRQRAVSAAQTTHQGQSRKGGENSD